MSPRGKLVCGGVLLFAGGVIAAVAIWAQWGAAPVPNTVIGWTRSAASIVVLRDQSGKLSAMLSDATKGSWELPSGHQYYASVNIGARMTSEATLLGDSVPGSVPSGIAIPWRRQYTTVCDLMPLFDLGTSGTASRSRGVELPADVVAAISSDEACVAQIRKEHAPWPPGNRREFDRDGVLYVTHRLLKPWFVYQALGAAAILISGGWLIVSASRCRRLRHACPVCGYDMRGLADSPCPECGCTSKR